MKDKSIKAVKTLIIYFFIIILITALSKTVYYSNLPVVTAESPKQGKLLYKLEARGTIEYKESENIYSPVSGKVSEILVSDNTYVKAGDEIFKISPDTALIKEAEIAINKKQNEIAVLEQKITLLKATGSSKEIQEIEDASSRLKKELGLFKNDDESLMEIKAYFDKVSRLNSEYEILNILYEKGAETKKNVENKKDEIQDALNQYKQFKANEIAKREEKQKELEKRKEEIRAGNISSENEIRQLRLNKDVLKLELDNLMDLHKSSKADTVYSAFDGIIRLSDIDTGKKVSEGDNIAKVFSVSDKYICEISLDEKEAEKIDKSSTLVIKTPSVSSNLKSRILRIYKKENEGRITAEIEIDSKEEIAGFPANITINTYSQEYSCIVKNSAVKKDVNSYYVFIVKESKDALNNYLVKRVDIEFLETDGSYTAVKGLELLEPVVIESSKDIFNSNKVRYVN